MVALLFYHQTQTVRGQLLEETSRLAATRLVMDRLSGELAAARLCAPRGVGLSGDSNSLHFVKLNFPAPWDRTNAPPAVSSASALRLVSYALLPQDTNTDVESGLLRSEEALVKSAGASASLAATNDPAGLLAGATNARPAGTVTSQIQFLRFRYYDGAAWTDTWNGPDLPFGVEATLGAEPLPDDVPEEEYPGELYRRVIYLPHHTVTPASSLGVPAFTEVGR